MVGEIWADELPKTRERLDEFEQWLVDVCQCDAQMTEKQLENLIKQKYKGKVPSIREPKENNKYFECDLPRVGDRRKKLKKATRLEILKEIYLFFYGTEYKEQPKPTLQNVWSDWIKYRQGMKGLSTKTVAKSKTEFIRFFGDSQLLNKPLNRVNTGQLEEELLRIVQDKKIPKKALNGMLTDLNKVFQYAVKHERIKKNPMIDIDVQMLRLNCTESTEKIDSDRILNDDEIEKIVEELKRREKKDPYNLNNYAIELTFYTGVRIGELMALKWSDVEKHGENYMLHIQRAERKSQVEGQKTEYLVGKTKTDSTRLIPLLPSARDILTRIYFVSHASDDNFIFIDRKTGKRMTTNTVGTCVRKVGLAVGVKNVSVHRIRRTVESKLVSGGAPINESASWMGHSIQVSARNYIYNQSTISEQVNKYSKYLTQDSAVLNAI